MARLIVALLLVSGVSAIPISNIIAPTPAPVGPLCKECEGVVSQIQVHNQSPSRWLCSPSKGDYHSRIKIFLRSCAGRASLLLPSNFRSRDTTIFASFWPNVPSLARSRHCHESRPYSRYFTHHVWTWWAFYDWQKDPCSFPSHCNITQHLELE